MAYHYYTVIDLATGENCGDYETLDEARGCVQFDRLTRWEIHRDEWELVESSEDDDPVIGEATADA